MPHVRYLRFAKKQLLPQTSPSCSSERSRRPYGMIRTGILGEGLDGTVYSATLRSKKGSRFVAEKNINQWGFREDLVAARKNWVLLKKLGIPVPKFYTILIRKEDSSHGGYSVLMENLTKRYGKIHPINDSKGNPVFLKKLKIGRDRKLIKEIASDLATINNSGYVLDYLDLWGLYKKPNGEYGRVAIDYTTMRKRENVYSGAIRSIQNAREFLGKEEFAYFFKEYNYHANEKIL